MPALIIGAGIFVIMYCMITSADNLPYLRIFHVSIWMILIMAQSVWADGVSTHISVISSQTPTTREITFTFPDAIIEPSAESGDDWQTVSVQPLNNHHERGRISLPFKTELVALPPKATVTVQVLDVDYTDITSIRLALGTQSGQSSSTGLVSTSAGFYPATIADIGFTGKLRGMPVAQVRVFPVQYDADKQTLRVYRQVVVRLTFSQPFPDQTVLPVGMERAPSSASPFATIYQRSVINPDDVSGDLP